MDYVYVYSFGTQGNYDLNSVYIPSYLWGASLRD